MFELHLDSVKTQQFINILDTIKDLPITDTNISIDEKGLSIQTMDPSHISLLNLYLSKDFFKEYQLDDKKPCVIGLHLISLVKIIRCAGKKDELIIKKILTSDTLDISLISEDKLQEFSIPLMDLHIDSMDLPEHNYPICYVLKPEILHKSIMDVSVVEGNTLGIRIGDEKLIFTCEGELGKTELRLEKEIDNIELDDMKSSNRFIIIKDDKSTKATYNLNLIKNITKAKSFSKKKVIISTEENFPLKISYRLKNNSHLHLYVAPKID